jgi:hypothetical protein
MQSYCTACTVRNIAQVSNIGQRLSLSLSPEPPYLSLLSLLSFFFKDGREALRIDGRVESEGA